MSENGPMLFKIQKVSRKKTVGNDAEFLFNRRPKGIEMLKKIFVLGIFFCCWTQVLFAASEQNVFDSLPASSLQNESPSSPSFEIQIGTHTEVIPRPGPIFTEGALQEGMNLPYLISTPKPIAYPQW